MEIEKGWQFSMFPELSKVQQQSLAKKVQTSIRNNLPDDTPEEVKKMFTEKSAQYAIVTDTYGHADVIGPKGAAQSLYSIDNNGNL